MGPSPAPGQHTGAELSNSLNMKLLRAFTIAARAATAAALAIGGRQIVIERDSDGLQDIVCPSYIPPGFSPL